MICPIHNMDFETGLWMAIFIGSGFIFGFGLGLRSEPVQIPKCDYLVMRGNQVVLCETED